MKHVRFSDTFVITGESRYTASVSRLLKVVEDLLVVGYLRLAVLVVCSSFLMSCTQISPILHTTSDQAQEIDRYLTTLAQRGFSGAVLVAQGDEIIIQKGYGGADKSGEVPITAETVFDTASLSKQFTAAAILHLEEQGLLRVEDTLDQFFRTLPTDKATITLHHLLTHSSGLPGYVYDGDYVPISREAAVERALNAPLQFEPGSRYFYSDTGYGLLAAVVEIVSGQPFADYLHEHLFEPAGMKSTGFAGEDRWADLTVAHGIVNGQSQGSPSAELISWGLRGFGGVLTTVGDLYRWHVALSQYTVLSASSTEKLFTPYIDEGYGDESFYGYGWVVMERPELGTIIWHDGASNAHNGVFLHYVDQDVVVIVLSNKIDGSMGDETFYGIETGFFLGRGLLQNDFSHHPDFTSS